MDELAAPGSFDATAVKNVARCEAGESLLAVAVYDPRRYSLLWIDEGSEGEFGDVDELFDVGDEIHQKLVVDHVQRQLFDDLHPSVGGVQAFTTYTERMTMVRVTDPDENTGVFAALERSADPTPLVDGLLSAVCGTE